MPTSQATALAKELLGESREELARADGRAPIRFAIAGTMIAAVLAGIIAGTGSYRRVTWIRGSLVVRRRTRNRERRTPGRSRLPGHSSASSGNRALSSSVNSGITTPVKERSRQPT
jgi:hypothetical protein